MANMHSAMKSQRKTKDAKGQNIHMLKSGSKQRENDGTTQKQKPHWGHDRCTTMAKRADKLPHIMREASQRVAPNAAQAARVGRDTLVEVGPAGPQSVGRSSSATGTSRSSKATRRR